MAKKVAAALVMVVVMMMGLTCMAKVGTFTEVRPERAEVVMTYDDTMIVETADGNQWEYTF